jgi:hypothetical protein
LKRLLRQQQRPPLLQERQVGGLNKRNLKQFLSPQQPQSKLQLGQLGLLTWIRQQQLVVKVVVDAVFTRWILFLIWRVCLIFLSLIFVVIVSISRVNLDRCRMKSGYSSRLQ